MTDQITNFNQITDVSNNVIQYDVTYVVDDGNGHINNFCVVVNASEMTNASDMTEAKTKANAKASVVKTAWITSLPTPVIVNQSAQIGTVTL